MLENEEYFDPAKVLQADEIMEKIQKALKEDNQALKEAFEQIGYFEGVYKPRPAIKPINGASPVQVEVDRSRRRRGP